MWPFKEKEIEEIVDPFSIEQRELQTEIFALYPVGKEFDYLGVTCKVTRHTSYEKGCFIIYGPHYPTIYPGFKCDYVDSNGVIKQISFSCKEVKSW